MFACQVLVQATIMDWVKIDVFDWAIGGRVRQGWVKENQN